MMCTGKTRLHSTRSFVLTSLAACALVLLAGCSSGEPPDAAPAEPAPAESAAAAPAPGMGAIAPADARGTGNATAAGALQALDGQDITDAALPGELACAFSVGQATLLYAAGMVGGDAPADALVRVDGRIQRLAAPGGFSGMIRGATFGGEAMTVDVAVTGAATGGGESPAYPATARVATGSQAPHAVDGQWSCGP